MVCETCKEARSADHDVRSHRDSLVAMAAKRLNPHVVSRRRRASWPHLSVSLASRRRHVVDVCRPSADTGSSIFLLLRVVTIATARHFERSMRPEPARGRDARRFLPRPMCLASSSFGSPTTCPSNSPPATVPAVVGTETSAARGAHALERGHTIASNTSKSTGV